MDWRPLTRSALRGHQNRQVLIARPDARGYYGTIQVVANDYVVLINNGFTQRVRYDIGPWHYQFIDAPQSMKIPKLADRQLPLEN